MPESRPKPMRLTEPAASPAAMAITPSAPFQPMVAAVSHFCRVTACSRVVGSVSAIESPSPRACSLREPCCGLHYSVGAVAVAASRTGYLWLLGAPVCCGSAVPCGNSADRGRLGHFCSVAGRVRVDDELRPDRVVPAVHGEKEPPGARRRPGQPGRTSRGALTPVDPARSLTAGVVHWIDSVIH